MAYSVLLVETPGPRHPGRPVAAPPAFRPDLHQGPVFQVRFAVDLVAPGIVRPNPSVWTGPDRPRPGTGPRGSPVR